MDIFEFILAPFIYFIENIYLLAYKLTNNYGWSIVLLSFVVSAVLLPIFIFIEKAKIKDDAIKSKMKPLLDEIKRCYKGQERYYYIQTLNRQYNYSPLRALIPILSLLIQIPFFIAAYQFLEGFEPLTGVSFLFIKDLSLPDGLLGSINILPILMTVVNLLTAHFYTRHGDGSERKQMLIIAGVFMVLLFKLPSGLVLYWTMNNVFSFLRLFITNPEVFKTSQRKEKPGNLFFDSLINYIKTDYKRILNAFYIVLTLTLLSQLNWAFRNNFDGFSIRILGAFSASFIICLIGSIILKLYYYYREDFMKLEIKPIYYFPLLFAALYFYIAGAFHFTGYNITLYKMSLLVLFPLQIVGLLYLIKMKRTTPIFLWGVSLFLVLFFGVSELFNSVLLLKDWPIQLELLNLSINIGNSSISKLNSSAILFVLVTVPFYISYHKIRPATEKKAFWGIYLLVIVYIIGLIFFWNPLLVFSSSPVTFDFPAINIFKRSYKLFFMSVFVAMVFYAVLPRKIKRIWLLLVTIIAVLSLVYTSIIPINLGSLQESRFSEQENLEAPTLYFLLEAILLIVVFYGVQWVYRKKYYKLIAITFLLLNLFLISQSIFKTAKTGFFFKSDKEIANSNEANKGSEGIPFSKDHQNVVFYLTDGFQGWFMDQIIKDLPELKDAFEGFVWYPNTLSISNYTHASLTGLMGGIDYDVQYLNSHDDMTITQSVTKVSEDFVSKIEDKGYGISSTYMHYSKIDKKRFDNFIPKWSKKWEQWSDIVKLGPEIWYKRLYENAIFYSVPLFLKPKVYNNKKWLDYYKKEEKKESTASLKKYNFVRLLPYNSSADADKGSFIYIHCHAAHNPWNKVTDDGDLVDDITPYENNKWMMQQFAKWIEWMKVNEVYDNTKIVFVSDHGASWDQYDGLMNFKSPIKFTKEDKKKISEKNFWRLNALLFVKDFNATGELKDDWRLMSNADVPAIVFDENDPTKVDSASRTLPSSFTLWQSEVINLKKLKIHGRYEVKDYIFDIDNWTKVE